MKTKAEMFFKVNKIKPLAKLTKKKERRQKITNTRNKRGDITTDPINIKREIGDCY